MCVDVRADLAATPIASCQPGDYRNAKCYVKFWLQPQRIINGHLQGGQCVMIKRVGENEFKCGALPTKTLEETAQWLEEYLRRYGVPYKGSLPWDHPFPYQI